MKVTSVAALLFVCLLATAPLFGSCSSPANPIEAENCLPGTPQSDWDISGAGDPSIQGFATDISVNVGQTISFKIKTDAAAYSIDIYRMGYYGGKGARLVASVNPSAPLPQPQPACLTDASTGLIDCGNWAISASWVVPGTAVSGIYFAHLIRTDTGGDSHIVFIVRNDASNSAILFQTADESWEAYNGYGGSSFYGPDNQFDLSHRAYKISYNRPFDTRGFFDESATWVFGAEYPMVRFLEANGYDVTYFTGIDAARSGALIRNHKIYVTAGHDEYWSGPHRANVEAARDAGVNMAFFTGNEVFWKTRLEPSIDGSNTPNRTLVCYKETLGPNSNPPAIAAVDPTDPPTWTGTWRDPIKSPPADGGRPENSLTGTLFMVNGPNSDNNGSLSIKVPFADGKMRFWRNTSVANLISGQTATLPKGTLGYEWDSDIDNGFRPAGLIRLSTATYTLTTDLLLDQGGSYGAGSATHHLTFYRTASGALVFGAGTVQWSWGLDSNHDNPFFSPNAASSVAMRQATINLFADMGVQPATLQAGLVAAAASADVVPPSSAISWPNNGATLSSGSTVSVSGTAADSGGGVVGAVEVSVDGGSTWHPANGRENWTYSWTPNSLGSFMLESRAVDDSGNIEIPSSTSTVVTINPHDCPCDQWISSIKPAQPDSGDSHAVEVGVRFRADFDGYITGIRFYKATTNTGTHVGNLWTSSGELLARATFANETASGWQQVTFDAPVPITANATYIASYFAPAGHYSSTAQYFASQGADNPPIHFLRDGVDGSNGLYSYSQSTTFPTSGFSASNYWVDVVYMPASSMPGAPPAVVLQPASLAFTAFIGKGNPPMQSIDIYNQGDGTLNWTATSSASWLTVTPSGVTPGALTVSVDTSGLKAGTYSAVVTVSSGTATNSPQTLPVSLSVSNLLLSSDFLDGTMQGWAFSPLGLNSNWSVVSNSLQYNGGGHTQVYAGDSSWTDYSLSASIKLSSLNDYPGGIRGRISPATGAGYAVWLYPTEGVVKLFRNVAWNIDSGVVLLGQSQVAFDTLRFHNVQLSFTGTQIQVSYDSKVIITANDSTYAAGLIALDVSNQPVSFSNILVTSATANTGSVVLGATSANFSAAYGSDPPGQNVSIIASGSGMLAWTATSNMSWLTVSPAYGATPNQIALSPVSSSLAPGNYAATVTVVSLGAAGETTQTIAVDLTIPQPAPVLVVSPSTIDLIGLAGQTVPNQNIAITNGAALGSFNWTASSDSSWLTLSSPSGSTPSSLNAAIDVRSLSPGDYTGNINVTSDGVANSPQVVQVNLQLLSTSLTENFEDGAAGWIISPLGRANGWSTSNGTYSYSGLGLSQSCTGNSAWTDYAVATNIQLSNTSNWPGGIRARVNPATGSGYAVWLYPASGKMVLYSVPEWNINAAGLTELSETQLAFDTNPHELKVDFRKNLITVYWDGNAVMSASDSAYSNGFICLDADSQPISYSNVRVASVQPRIVLDAVTPSSLVFSAAPDSPSPVQRLNISAGGQATAWSAVANVPWIKLTSSSFLTPSILSVAVDPSGLATGAYNGVVTLSAPGASNSPITIPVMLGIKSALIAAVPAKLTFFGATTLNPEPQAIQVTNAGTGSLNWTVGATNTWLGLNPGSGSAPSTILVSPDTSMTGVGSFTDTITVSSGDAANAPVMIPLTVQVGSLLFNDDFSAGASNWTISPLGNSAGWSVSNGTYSYDGGGHTQSYAGSPSWSDYTVAADFQLSSLNDYPGGLRGRLNTSTGASYGVWIYPAERVLKLFRIGQWNIDADLSLLAQSEQLSMDSNWHHLRLVFQNTSILVYYDDALVITATDSTLSQGAIALDVSDQAISFDNVTVVSLP